MEEIHLSYAGQHIDRIGPLLTGEVKPRGITLHFERMANPDVYYQQVKFHRWDLSEMSFSFALIALSRGAWPYKLLPIFHHRFFPYTTLQVHADAGIEKPEDLKGKRIGSFDYAQTMSLWTMGQLHHEFGVKPTDVIWYQERSEQFSVVGAFGDFKVPPGLDVRFATTDFATMFLNREIDGGSILHHPQGASLERPKQDLTGHPKLKTLFPDPQAEAVRYYKKNGVIPLNCPLAIRTSIIEEHPWVATSLTEAFGRAKQLTMERFYGRDGVPPFFLFGRQALAEQREIFGDDPNPDGIKANAKAIDMIQDYALELGFTPKKQPLEEIFAEEVLVAEESLG